jgi:hypothetical protein
MRRPGVARAALVLALIAAALATAGAAFARWRRTHRPLLSFSVAPPEPSAGGQRTPNLRWLDGGRLVVFPVS